jgi:septal ring factor EnvC (AmiA/AmiB activator)
VTQNKVTRLARLLVLCSLILSGTAYADKQEELKNLRERIAAVKREMDKTTESKVEAADALRESELAISNTWAASRNIPSCY